MQIGVVAVPMLIPGIVEAAKGFGLTGKRAIQGFALAVGFFLYGVAAAISQGLVPEAAVVWVQLVVYSLAGGLSAMGYYDLGKKFLIGQ